MFSAEGAKECAPCLDGTYSLAGASSCKPCPKTKGVACPGGKLEPGEKPEATARRELAEELELDVTNFGALLHTVQDEDSPFMIEFYPAEVTGDPVPREHTELAWLSSDKIATIALAPADRNFLSWFMSKDADNLGAERDQESERR